MGKRGLLVCLIGLALGAPAVGEPDLLRVGTSGDYAPFSVAAPEAPLGHAGFDIDLARAYAQERGLRLELVPFRWPKLATDLEADRFDVAMSGVTVRPDRSVAGRFSAPLAESGAVVLVRDEGRFASLDAVDRRGIRIAVNAGGHLERAAEAHFQRATLVSIPDNSAVLAALESFSVDAVVTDTLEAPIWRLRTPDLVQLGPFTRDRKACLVRAERAALAADLDAWILAREQDGSLGKLRRKYFDARARPTATPLGALVAALDERLALMPWVVAAKRRDVRPISDRAREKRVLDAATASVSAAARRAGVEPPAEEAVLAFFRAQIDAAVQIQLTAARSPEGLDEAGAPDLESELRPALLRIGERIAALLLALPDDLDAASARAAVQDGLRSPWLSEASRASLVEALVAVATAPRAAPAAAPAK